MSEKTKGQIMTADFLLAMIIIILVIGIITTSWNRSVYLLRMNSRRLDMRRLGLSISSMLVKSAGMPEDWSSANVASIGLAKELNVIDKNKMTEFNSMGEANIKDLLGIEEYEFNLAIRAVNDTILSDYGNRPIGQSDVIVVRRAVVYEGVPAVLELSLWK